MRKNLTLILSCAVLFCTVGCGKSGPSYFPLEIGLWRYYATETKILDESKQQRIIAGIAEISKSSDGRNHYVHRQAPDQDTYITVSEGNILGVARRDRTTLVETWYPQPLRILPSQPKLGDTWTIESELALIESRTFARQDKLRNRTIHLSLAVEITALDDFVEIPAGRYENCLKLQSTGVVNVRTDRGNANAEVLVSQNDWYAPGIGLVKSVRSETSESPFLKPGSYTQTMIAVGRE